MCIIFKLRFILQKKISIFILIFCLFFSFVHAKSTQDILLIHSYHKGYKWSDEISKVFDEKFGNRKDVFLTTVYMDTKRVATKTYFKKLFELYKEQFKNRKFNLVVVSDNYAFEFFQKYHLELFPLTPLVFLGINDFKISELKKAKIDKITTGVVEQVDIEKNIQLILKLHPKVSKILIINDKSKTGLALKRNIFKVLPKYAKKVKFEYIDDTTIEKLEQKVSMLPKNTVILWGLLFKDKTGRYFTHKESLHTITKVASVPIYGLWDFYLGEGIVGGLLTSAKAQASVAAKMSEMILRGKNPSQIPILMKSPNRYIFDYKELQRFHIHIPKDFPSYEIVNKPFSFYEKYKKYVWTFFIVSLLGTFIVLILSYNIMKRIKSEKALKNQLNFINVLLNSVSNPINYKNLNGEYIGCNNAFAKLVGKHKKDIIGKNVYEILPKDWAQEESLIEEKILQNSTYKYFEKSLHVNNQTRIITCSKTVFKDSAGSIQGIVNVMVDRTEFSLQKQFLIQQSKLAEMGEMVAAIAHQWNEPLVELSAILQDLEFTYLSGDMHEQNMKGFVHESMAQIQYMSETLKDFRNFLKPSKQKSFFSAKKALDSVIEVLGKHIFYSYISLHVEVQNEDIVIYGYENEFKQVLLNIVNNAKHKMRKQKKQGNIWVNLSKNKKWTKFEISDDAGLIPNHVIDFIFDPYFTTNKEEGTGLGLYMAKVIIEDKMNGKIWVRNIKNRVVFTLIVPNNQEEKNENSAT